MKVRIIQHQPVPDSPGIFVLSPTGDYGPLDPIECYLAGMSGVPYCIYQAQFVKFGSIVYREGEYIEMLRQLGVVEAKPETLQGILESSDGAIIIDKDPRQVEEEKVIAAFGAEAPTPIDPSSPAVQYTTTSEEIVPEPAQVVEIESSAEPAETAAEIPADDSAAKDEVVSDEATSLEAPLETEGGAGGEAVDVPEVPDASSVSSGDAADSLAPLESDAENPLTTIPDSVEDFEEGSTGTP